MKKNDFINVLNRICILLLFLFFFELFYRQSVSFSGQYLSDLPAHISSALNGSNSYSILSVILNKLYYINGSTIYISAFLSTIVLLTIYFCYKTYEYMIPDGNKMILYGLAVVSNVVLTIRVEAINPSLYLGAFSASCWHNSTYTVMKLLGVIIFYYFLILYKKYLNNIKVNEWISFAFLLICVNLVKPNFILSFAPTMALFLLFDLVTSRGKSFKQAIVFGSSVLPSISVMLYQYMVLYGSGSSDGSGIAISFAYILKGYSEIPLMAVFQAIAFPLCVLCINFKMLKKDIGYRFVWVMWLIGFGEYLFLQETGIRANDGNFAWGNSFCLFLLFTYSIYIYYKDVKCYKIISTRRKIIVVLTGFVLFLHLAFGILYLCRLILGYAPWK